MKIFRAMTMALLLTYEGTGFAAEPPESKPTAAAQKPDAAAGAPDKLALDATVITGNRELPKVLYIVPWKKADLGELPGQPFNTLLDEALAPVDREVFRREVDYYRVIASPLGDTQAAPEK